MIKIGLIGAVKTHAYVFSSIFNGGEENDWPDDAWKPETIRHLDDARIVKVWYDDPQAAELLAKTCNIPEVAETPQGVADGVDAVLIADDTTLLHSKHWRIFLERGIPTFIDKPLADNPGTVEEIIDYAQEHNCLLMSSSALRYAAEMPALKEQLRQIGAIRTGMVTGRPKGRLINYGIHAVELLHAAVGPGAESVQTVGQPGRQVIKIDYSDGRVFTFHYCQGLKWDISLLGEQGQAHVAIRDNDGLFTNLMEQFLGMIKTKILPVPLEETREIVKLCLAAEESSQTDKAVKL